MSDAWPVDEQGRPLVKVTMGYTDKVNTGNYNNVTVGPVSITKLCKEEDVDETFEGCIEIVERIMGEKRQKILDELAAV